MSTDEYKLACADSIAHRYGRCLMAVAAWRWAQQVMRMLGLEYFGTMSGFWLYGGPKALMQHRAVSVMRGAFFEAQQAVRWRL